MLYSPNASLSQTRAVCLLSTQQNMGDVGGSVAPILVHLGALDFCCPVHPPFSSKVVSIFECEQYSLTAAEK